MTSRLLAITIDVEWAPLPILEEMFSKLTTRQIPFTLFCTNEPYLSPLPGCELALHPNFNGMKDWEETLNKMQKMYPSAHGLRAHCLHSDTRLIRLLPQRKISYQSNLFVPGQVVAPYRRESGLWEIPIHYMDFFHLCVPEKYPAGFTINSIPSTQKLMVVDFHPIPWFINAAKLSDYEKAKPSYKDVLALKKSRRQGDGIATLFDALIREVTEGHWKAVTLSEVVQNLQENDNQLWQWPDSTPVHSL